MSNLREIFVDAYTKGCLIQAISDALRSADTEEELALTLTAAHNDGDLNAIEVFSTFKNSGSGPDFFQVRAVFENCIPNLSGDIVALMGCVQHLYKEAGQDMAASMVLASFAKFCEKDASRTEAALKEIEKDQMAYADLLISALQGGFHTNLPVFLDEAVQLTKHKNIEIKRRAVLSLSNIKWADTNHSSEPVLIALEQILENENDDQILSGVIHSAHKILEVRTDSQSRALSAIKKALQKGSDQALHQAAMIFAFNTAKLPQPLLDLLLDSLLRVLPAHTNTLRLTGVGASNLIKEGNSEPAITLIENFLIKNPGLKLDSFGTVPYTLRKNAALRNKVITRWLMSGNFQLAVAAEKIPSATPLEGMELEVDSSEINSADLQKMVFLARKIVGFFFTRPICAASLLISLIGKISDSSTQEKLGRLLTDPLLINFTGKLHDYIKGRAETETGRLKEILNLALQAIDEYLKGLQSVGNLPALYISIVQKEAYARFMHSSMTEAFKEAEKQSVLLSMISKSTLLYTDRSVNYIYGPNGESHRTEMDLKPHGVEFEVPRLEMIDPCGLDYTLRVFRAEKLPS